jgi:hypothetical protein
MSSPKAHKHWGFLHLHIIYTFCFQVLQHIAAPHYACTFTHYTHATKPRLDTIAIVCSWIQLHTCNRWHRCNLRRAPFTNNGNVGMRSPEHFTSRFCEDSICVTESAQPSFWYGHHYVLMEANNVRGFLVRRNALHRAACYGMGTRAETWAEQLHQYQGANE